jgi:CPA2 family monovalent cation:H+ antiporter-2
MINDKSSVLIMGILIVEDVIVITMLGILQSVALTAAVSFINVLLSVGIVLGFIAAILILGSRYLPPVIDKLARKTDYSVLIIVILGLAFGLSFVAIELGLSPVIGAFLAGVLVAESNSAGIARVITIPLRDVFAALFFVSIGALVDVSKIPLFIIPALILIATSFMVKMMIVIPVLIRAGYDTTTAVRTGLGLSSARGEMSLIVGKGGQDVGAVSSYILPILGVVTIVTTFATPYILKMGTKLNISSAPGEDKK